MVEVDSPWLTVPKAARYLQMDKEQMRRLVFSGAIPSHRRSERRIFVHRDDLDAYMMSFPSAAVVPPELR